MTSSGDAWARGSSWTTWRSIAIPMSWAATREARRRASGSSLSPATTGRSCAVMNSRSMAAAFSLDTAERTRAMIALRLSSLSANRR